MIKTKIQNNQKGLVHTHNLSIKLITFGEEEEIFRTKKVKKYDFQHADCQFVNGHNSLTIYRK